MENEAARAEIARSGPEQKTRSTPDNREYIIQSCYELLSSGLPLATVLEEANRLANLTEITHPSATCQPDLLQASEAVRVEKTRRIRLPRMPVFTSFWLVTVTCSVGMIVTAVIAVVSHLPAAAEATLPIDVPFNAAQVVAGTSSEPVVLLAEVLPNDTGRVSGQESFANAPIPMSNLFEDLAEEHPLGVTHDHGLARSAACHCGPVVQGRVQGRLDTRDRYAPRTALGQTGRRDNYKPAYNRLLGDYSGHPQPTGFYGSSHPNSVWPGTLPHRVRVGAGVVEYDALIGRYVPLARADLARIAAQPLD